MQTKYRIGGDRMRELLADAIATAPFYAKESLQKMLERDVVLDVTFEQVKRLHTDAQRGYYWLCVGIFAKFYGSRRKEDMHEIVLCQAFGSKTITLRGETYHVPLERSADKTVDEYGVLIETLLELAEFAGCPLPDPVDVHYGR